MTTDFDIPGFILEIAERVERQGGTAYIVGGWVRDCLLGIPSADFDIEVYGLDVQQLLSILSEYGKPSQVGKSFGIVTLHRGEQQFDFAFPRTENKTGKGHRGFMVTPDPALTFDAASARRDFTINAMGMKLPDFEIVDYHGGRNDLERRLLRHVSGAFAEDPLRVLRAVQFAARFEMDIAPETQRLCTTLPLEELSAERIFGEMKKLLLKSRRPSIGLDWMRRLKLLRYFPELDALIGVRQDPEWHPEGDVWTHNNMAIDEAAMLRNELPDEKEQLACMFGALCHDFGKPGTTAFIDGRWRSPGHEAAGELPARTFLGRITNDSAIIEETIAYVRTHLRPMLLYKQRSTVSQGAIRRLALEMDIRKIVRLATADHFGRTAPDALERSFPAGEWLLQQAALLDVADQAPRPFLRGKDLIDSGIPPGPAIGVIIKESFNLQLDGEIQSRSDALVWLRRRLSMERETA